MKIIYLLLLLLGFYAVFVYGRFKFILAQADLAEIRQIDRTVGTGPKLKYIAGGDSTAVGVGASRVEKTYAYRVADYLGTKHEVEYKNIGVIGATTSDLVQNQLSEIVKFDPDIITISIGANDVTHWVDSSKIIENYKTIIKELTQNSKAKIYITDVPRFDYSYLLPWPMRTYFDSRAKDANAGLLNLGMDSVKFVDIHKVEVSNSRDQFHPNDEGYNNWAQAFLDKIKADF